MSEIISLDVNSLETAEIHQILLTAVAPRPIALASSINNKGEVNLSPFSFFNVFSANPPILIFSPARRVRNNTTKHTLENAYKVKEVVINIVNYPIVEQMSLSSTEYDKGINEFDKSGLTPIASKKVKPPRVKESPISFECEIDNIIELGDQGGAGNLIISRVVMIHINSKYLDGNGKLDTTKLDLVARMGANWYTRVTQESLFEITKPIKTKGIGVDKLPKHIFKTNILTGNNIGRLGNAEKIPTEEELSYFKNTPEIASILQINDNKKRIERFHEITKEYLLNENVDSALKAVFCCLYSND